jgi:hypothetical protein
MVQTVAEQEVENLSGLSTNPEKDIFVVRENGTTCLMAEFAAKFIVPYDVWASNYVDVRNLFPPQLAPRGGRAEGHPPSRPCQDLSRPPLPPQTPRRLFPNAAWGFRLATPSARPACFKSKPPSLLPSWRGVHVRVYPHVPGPRSARAQERPNLQARVWTRIPSRSAPGPGALRGRGACVFPADHRTG